MLPLPLIQGEYNIMLINEVSSTSLIYWSHIPTAFIGLIFTWFIYQQTKKLSAFYLFVTALCFSFYSFLDIYTWVGRADTSMFTWSLLDIFSVLFVTFTAWFFYAYATNKDLPLYFKLGSLTFIIPPFIYTLLSLNISTYYAPELIAFENDFFINYAQVFVPGFFLLIVIMLLIRELSSNKDRVSRIRIVLGGLGAAAFLLIFMSFQLVAALQLYFNIANSNIAYAYTAYSLFAMPILIMFFGYLVTKYQAFDLKLTRAVGFVILMMLLLFVSIFI